MSHFVCMVLGAAPEEQLEPFSEHLECDEYSTGEVGSEEISRFMIYANEEAAKEGFKGQSFEELYAKYGNNWNGSRWKIGDSGILEDFSTYNPQSKWDWYEIGGRWRGYLKLRLGDRGLDNRGCKKGYTNQCYKKQVDWDGMIQDSKKQAEQEWDEVAALVGVDSFGKIRHPQFTWMQATEATTSREAARELYTSQEEVKAFEKTKHWGELVENMHYTRQEYVDTNAYNGITPYCCLYNGEWYEKGKMLMFGMSTASEEDEKNWSAEFYSKFIEPLDGNTLITIVDCHI